eukprot:scaffold2893_cov83-Phaeocystis_antarctica.AAC.2
MGLTTCGASMNSSLTPCFWSSVSQPLSSSILRISELSPASPCSTRSTISAELDDSEGGERDSETTARTASRSTGALARGTRAAPSNAAPWSSAVSCMSSGPFGCVAEAICGGATSEATCASSCRTCRLGVAAQLLRQPAAQLHRAQRVEPRLHQRRVGAHAPADHLGDHRAHRITICWHTGQRRARRRIQRRALEHRRQLHEQWAIRLRSRGSLRRRHERGNVRLQLAHGGVVEDQRLRQCRLGVAAQPLRQPAAQLHRAQRVEPRLHQRRVGAHVPADHLGDHRAHRDASVGHKQRSRTPVAGWLRGGRELRRCRSGRRALCDGVNLRDELHRAGRERRELDKLVGAPAERVHAAEAVRGEAVANGGEVGGRVSHARVEAREQRGVDGASAAHAQREHGGRRARAVREDAD